jgi:hypothetical protein
MAPVHSREGSMRSAPNFFQPRPRRNVPTQDYANIERPQFHPSNTANSTNTPTIEPASSPASNLPLSSPNSSLDEAPGLSITVEVPPGHEDYPDDDEEMADTDSDQPPLTDTIIPMTLEEKASALTKWKKNKKAHLAKKRTKNSHVYWYMNRQVVPEKFYPEYEGGPKIFQQIRWSCAECVRKPNSLGKDFVVLESHRKGVTTGMLNHLKNAHHITVDTHFARIRGYGITARGGEDREYTEGDAWSGRPRQRARLTAREATRRWFIKCRIPFSNIESDDFQEMFLAHNSKCSYKSRHTLRNHIFDDWCGRREKLKIELEYNCISISFTLDMWTAPNRVPIFAIIGHWWTQDFEEREEVLEFLEVKGSHTGEALARHVEHLLEELNIKPKLFAITGDNAGNNGTLCEELYKSLKVIFDDKISPIGKPTMRFHGRPSWVRCLAHVVALVCSDVLSDLNTGTAKEAKKLLDSWEEAAKGKSYTIQFDASRSGPAKIRLMNLWTLRSSPREQDWKNMPKTRNRKPIYDIDTRWNSCKDMLEQYIELEPEYNHFIDTHPEIEALRLTDAELIAVHQLNCVLSPFKEHTLQVSKDMPSISESLEIYWSIDHLLKQVIDGAKDDEHDFSELDDSICQAFKKGQLKHIKYMKKLKDFSMLYSAHVLDPRNRLDIIETMMPDDIDEVRTTIRKYMIAEFPKLGVQPSPPPLSSTNLTRPPGISIGQWTALQAKRAREIGASSTTPISELDRWLASPAIEVNYSVFKTPDYLRTWWKNNASEWPLLAEASRVLLSTSASEVDVERLFSGCRDEFGIRRHSLKAETIRVLTLLRSAYTSEDEVDKQLIKDALELDILPFRNSILWRPDLFDGHIDELGKLANILLFIIPANTVDAGDPPATNITNPPLIEPPPPPPPTQLTTPAMPSTPIIESILGSEASTPCPDRMDIS